MPFVDLIYEIMSYNYCCYCKFDDYIEDISTMLRLNLNYKNLLFHFFYNISNLGTHENENKSDVAHIPANIKPR